MPIARRATLAAVLSAPAISFAQAPWPSGVIRIVAPFPPGGSVDTIARLLQPGLQARLGVPVVVENRAGASGALGAGVVARAPPDGNTWVLVFDSHAVNDVLQPTLGFDGLRDFTPVMLVATSPMLLCTPNARPWRDFGAVIAAARTQRDGLTYGTVGAGSLAHLTMTLLASEAHANLVHVPYRGGGPMATAAAAGEVDLVIASRAGLGGQVGQTIRPLAQSGARRSPALPDVPTIAEQGFPNVAAEAFWGMLGPAGVPAPILARFHAALFESLADAGVRERLVTGQGVDIVASSPEAFGAFLSQQMATWRRVVRENNIRND
ncbi:Bug family tripartite tricarboxylate transporter substrate binding protein [Plastoroseomonas arctica]|uniref:Tripartite tricarboxylate transporter substrate binding protein n=1 Tax=Plastoroseomonas arctica TaxID=1509237 RepID=A0AAF1KQZ9_9PROT|nr:tripartite tricarboxylate transporter substrate-binding protein [Plastoroseomonas arctica]MBR0653712.1 tripartite tricarboxylate transporter substrate binding protein [Plastoroseomonas arctica]